MTAVDPNLFDDYFSESSDIGKMDRLAGIFLFCSGMRPVEFMNISRANLNLATEVVHFQQAKGGSVTDRSMSLQVLTNADQLWEELGNPLNYYYNYQRLTKYVRRMVGLKFTLSNRMDELYPFRYACAGALKHQGYTDQEIIDWFQHDNPSNTMIYINEGILINAQIFGS